MSVERFKRDICQGTSCFLCGVERDQATFNDEHILPAWLLRRFDLHNESITLPNDQRHRYSTYRISCCKRCNDLLGKKLETPLSKVLAGGHSAIAKFARAGGSGRLFTWMALIFFKIHLKDANMRFHVNRSLGDNTIAETHEYDWGPFHHLHCLVRAVYAGATVFPGALGSLAILPAAVYEKGPVFDLIDLSYAQTLAIRLGDFVIYAVFDDSGAVMTALERLINRIEAPLNSAQIREMAAHFACCNLHFKNRPEFMTWVQDSDPPKVFIAGYPDSHPEFHEFRKDILGQFLLQVLGRQMPIVNGMTPEEALKLMTAGELTFLFDDVGNFLVDGYRPQKA